MNILSKNCGPLLTMKKLAVCAVLVFACVSANAENKDFDKLSKIKEVEVMHIDKNMINLAAQSGAGLHIGDAINFDDEDGDMIKTINEIKIYHCEKKGAMEKFKKEATKILKAKKWQALIDQKGEEGEIVKIYQAKDGEQNSNVIFASEEDEAVVIVIDGAFDLTKAMGMGNNNEDGTQNEQ
jgi:hypothetical protein